MCSPGRVPVSQPKLHSPTLWPDCQQHWCHSPSYKPINNTNYFGIVFFLLSSCCFNVKIRSICMQYFLCVKVNWAKPFGYQVKRALATSVRTENLHRLHLYPAEENKCNSVTIMRIVAQGNQNAKTPALLFFFPTRPFGDCTSCSK